MKITTIANNVLPEDHELITEHHWISKAVIHNKHILQPGFVVFGGECEDTTALVFTGNYHRGATLDPEYSLHTTSLHPSPPFSSKEQNIYWRWRNPVVGGFIQGVSWGGAAFGQSQQMFSWCRCWRSPAAYFEAQISWSGLCQTPFSSFSLF